jgi:plasmid maintenance system antidote protein VapI
MSTMLQRDDVAQAIRRQLSERDLTVQEFARLIGVPRQTVYAWLTRSSRMKHATATRIARSFGMTLAELLE